MLIKTTIFVVFLCSIADIGNCACKDDESLIFPYNGQNMSCAEILAIMPCTCKKTLKNNLGQDVKIKKACCVSCKAADVSECVSASGCQNLVDAQSPIEFGNTVLNSCDEMVNQIPELCKTLGNKKNTPCCKACKDVSFKCLDTKLKVWNTSISTNLNCEQLIAEDKCHCFRFNKDCCESCKSFDSKKECCNDPNFKTSLKIRGSKKKKIDPVACKKCTCDEILAKDVRLMDLGCRKNKKIRTKCCKNCKKVGAPMP